jgi:hypothetical protein
MKAWVDTRREAIAKLEVDYWSEAWKQCNGNLRRIRLATACPHSQVRLYLARAGVLPLGTMLPIGRRRAATIEEATDGE